MRYLYLLSIVCILFALFPCVGAVVTLSWDNLTGDEPVGAMDSNSAGTLLLVGLGNGTILGIDTTVNTTEATVLWGVNVNSTATNKNITKIVATSNGDFAWISRANESGFISSSGVLSGKTNGTGRNVTDVGISADGSTYAVSELANAGTSTRLTIYHSDGTIHAQNTTFGNGNWIRLGYDPNGQWLVSANQSDTKLYLWNIISWLGWEEFNPTHISVKNASLQFIDSFPYRENITLGASATTQGIFFVNTSGNVSSSVPIYRVNDTMFQYYRPTTGNTFLWTLAGELPNSTNFTNLNQSAFLNLSVVQSSNYNVVFRPGNLTFTAYFGNTTYDGTVLNQSWTNNGTLIRHNFTASQAWTIPFGVDQVNVSMIGGGGAGGSGGVASGGYGGSRGLLASYSILTSPGSSATIGVGAGGYKPPGFSPYVNATNSSFSNGTMTFYAANGTQNGSALYSGESGNITIPGYPSSTAGEAGSLWVISYCNPTSAGAGNTGYGAGGGGGGQSDYTCMDFGNGGNGANGVVQVSYYVNDVPIYYYGAAPTTTLGPLQMRQSSDSLNLTATKEYVGSILGIGVPNSGGLASISTDTILYQQYLSSSGFGVTYNATLSSGAPALFAGTPHDIKTSNSGTATAEGRGAYGLVYDSGAVAKASSLTGADLLSVDSAMSSGLIAGYGGTEGKLYVLSRSGSASWYSLFTGTAGSSISSVVTSWDGSYIAVGRTSGLVEFYNTSINVVPVVTPTSGAGSNVDASLRVYKNSMPYQMQNITIYSSSTPTNWIPLNTSYTDGNGRMAYTCQIGTYYKFVVNNVVGTTSGEGEAIWQANSASTVVQIYVLEGSLPYEWGAVYDATHHNVSVTYTDTVTSDITVTIKDTKQNMVVLTRNYPSTQGFNLEYHDQLENGTYQVSIQINRMGMTTRDSRSVTSQGLYNIPLPIETWLKYALATLTLMLIAGMFGYANSRRGAFAVVLIAVAFIAFGWLPLELTTALMVAGMLAVASLFGSRVQ